ncbi:MAG: hypothetical protein JO023_26050 [Chloroflexi bacterium]|nr:hypothetical protein [Chloroflexota bacterium]
MAAFVALVRPARDESLPGDTYDYAYGAAALLRGSYLVDWNASPHMPRYPPGFSVLLMPAVALGGVQAAAAETYGMALVLAALCALVAARVAGPAASPIAVLLALFAPAVAHLSRLSMSDLPTATLVMLELAILMMLSGPVSLFVAGLLAGGLAWMRAAAWPLVLAGLLASTARADMRRGRAVYLVGALLPLLALGLWQLAAFGSPLITTYQAAGATPNGDSALSSFFSMAYAFSPPAFGDGTYLGGDARQWKVANAIFYPLQLLGMDGFVALPGLGLVGLLALAWFAREHGHAGVLGRFGLATIGITLLVYIPYFWQSGRFLLVASPLFAVATAALVVQGVRQSRVVTRRWWW